MTRWTPYSRPRSLRGPHQLNLDGRACPGHVIDSMATDLRLPTDRIVRPDKDRFLNEENPFEAMMSRFQEETVRFLYLMQVLERRPDLSAGVPEGFPGAEEGVPPVLPGVPNNAVACAAFEPTKPFTFGD